MSVSVEEQWEFDVTAEGSRNGGRRRSSSRVQTLSPTLGTHQITSWFVWMYSELPGRTGPFILISQSYVGMGFYVQS